MKRIFSVLQADTDAARQAIKNAGCTHAIINANWNLIQPSNSTTADSAALAALVSAFDHARSIGLKVILSINLHYAPNWVLSSVEPFRDQLGNDYLDTDIGGGKAVRNWVWTQAGRNLVTGFFSRVAAALGSTRIAAVDAVRLGGGWYGELHFPQSVPGGPTYAWQGFSPSMQAGTGIASGMDACPLPGYVPYSGTDAQDCLWLNWYLNGLVTFGRWLIAQHKAIGLNRNLFLMLPGYGVRTNMLRTDGGYKQAAALGEDHIRAVAAIMHDPAAWPYSTWMNTADGFPGGTVDSDKSAWKSLYEKSLVRGKHHQLIGENTGGESNTGMDGIFSGSLGNGTYAGGPAAPSKSYYQGLVWLGYPSLTGGGAEASLAHLAASIASSAA